jgi:putative transposase
MKYAVIHDSRGPFVSVAKLCQVFEVSKSGFYKWKNYRDNPRSVDPTESALEANVIRVHFDSKRNYGVRKVQQQLKNEGIKVSQNKVYKLMTKNNLKAKTKKAFKPKTTDSNHKNKIAPRVFKVEENNITKPNQIWAGDITYIPTREGWLYLSVFIDLYSRLVVGYATADHLRVELVRESFVMALKSRPIEAGLIIHTDRGVQYTATEFRELLGHLALEQSMSRKGNCYDNAFVESFFAQMKKEFDKKIFDTKLEAEKEIFNFINSWYNTKRIHSSLGYISPEKFEKNYEALAS